MLRLNRSIYIMTKPKNVLQRLTTLLFFDIIYLHWHVYVTEVDNIVDQPSEVPIVLKQSGVRLRNNHSERGGYFFATNFAIF